ncbi:hypothetical protein OOU_Y34scaffold00641g39 [Pyricularia oryzae Y34]|uniref:Uncharacterized protein n=2 Tax=Pyricularia oryzae TaxID=318829 RepID=A0AA97NUS0_PYRO3|nr:hypothetical protein OOU_Y34scaffold00641g39 [Pyricularia oryzae Y34]
MISAVYRLLTARNGQPFKWADGLNGCLASHGKVEIKRV